MGLIAEGMPIMAIAITSLCWMVITGLLLALMFFFLRRKAPPSTGFEKEFEEYAQCVTLMASYVHTTYYSLLLQHKCFLDNIINCLTAYEQRTACFLKETGAGIRTCAQLDKMDDIFAEANRRDTILGQGGTLEKTKIMENVAYRKLHFNHVSNSHDDKDIYLLVARFIESKKGRKCTETVEILAPNLEGSTKEVSKKEKDKARKKGEKEVKGNTKKENVDEEKEEKRQSAGLSLDLSVKTQENNIKRKNKIPEHVKHLDNTVAKWMNTKPNTKEEKKIADAWLSLGVIDRLLTEINETGRKFAMNYNQITFQVCRIVMNEVKERTLINNEQAYDPENPRGKIKNMHEFIHVLEHLYTDEDPQAERLKMDLTIYEWSRFLDFHYMGFDYNEHKGSLVYVRPSPMHGEPFSQAMLRLERYEKDYEKLKAKVEEYCKKKKLKLVTKKTSIKQPEIREKYDFAKYTFDDITEAAGIFEMKAEDAAKAVKASEDAKANKILDLPAPKSYIDLTK
ncbi:unnamed protein product [Caenorhabditis auriculariae]|uniref:Uncharacterized protein n=1 Tax=Caenorhabditis auriculariae TaxID=2777116 RepID=A0A8S1HXJ9_9PELO|nr:unnamed protein product [Caenorhabditis auriculariae]